jgi:outer membrane lipoprotein-sorting protein
MLYSKGGMIMKKLLVFLIAILTVLSGCAGNETDTPDANETGGNAGQSDGGSSTS